MMTGKWDRILRRLLKDTYKQTLHASYLGFITQAIINNLAPLLFVIFHDQFGISLKDRLTYIY